MKEHSGNAIGKKMTDEKYNFLFERAAIPAVLTKLPEYTFVEINESFQKIFGYSKNEVIGKTSLQLGMVLPEEREQTIKDLQRHGFAVDLEKHVYTKSGDLRNVLVNVNAFKWNDQEFAIATLQDISARKCAEVALDTMIERLDLATRSANIGIYDWDIINDKLVWDEQMYRLYGINKSAFNEAYEAWLNGIHPDDRVYSDTISKKALRGEIDYITEFRVLWPDGTVHWLKALGQIFRDKNGNPTRMVGINYDITKEKESQQKIIQLKRLYATLSQINKTIVRVKERSELFQSICNVSVIFGEFKNACIYILGEDGSTVTLTACNKAGQEDMPLQKLNIDDPDFKNDIISHSIRGNRTVTSEDIWHDPRMEQWRKYSVRMGYRSQASVPFRVKGKSIGVLNLYSAETGFFKADEEILLLEEIGLNISFALDSIEIEKEQIRGHIALQQTQEKLIFSENTLKLFVEYAPASIAMFDREMKYLAVSKRFIADYRLNYNDIIGLSHYEVFPEIGQNWKSVHLKCLEGATEKVNKDPFMRNDGHLDWIQWEIHPWYEKSGQIGGLVLFSEVITERIKAEEELIKSEKRFRTTLETMLEGCQIMDFNWRFVYVNHAAEIHNHIPRDKMLGITYTEVWPGIEKTNVYSVIKSCLEQRTVTHMENEFSYPDGSVGWFELSILPVPEGVFILSIDITERKKAEEKLTEALEKLEHRVIERTNQLEAANKELEAFSYSVSHDLRAPLRAMSGFARILEESYSSFLDEEGKRVLQIITGNAKKMGLLIDDLLAFSRLGKQETNSSIINMHEMAESIFNELASEKEKKDITFILHTLPPAYGDVSMIKHVLANLVGNSIKFSSLKEHRVIEIDGYEDGMENIYFVKDNGAGFNMKYVSKLFGVFQRLHSAKKFEGTGVGLAIVQRIIHRMNGRVWAEGIENEGASFYFTLPNQVNDDSGK